MEEPAFEFRDTSTHNGSNMTDEDEELPELIYHQGELPTRREERSRDRRPRRRLHTEFGYPFPHPHSFGSVLSSGSFLTSGLRLQGVYEIIFLLSDL